MNETNENSELSDLVAETLDERPQLLWPFALLAVGLCFIGDFLIHKCGEDLDERAKR